MSTSGLGGAVGILSRVPFPSRGNFCGGMLRGLHDFFFFVAGRILGIGGSGRRLRHLGRGGGPFFITFRDLGLRIPRDTLSRSTRASRVPRDRDGAMAPSLCSRSSEVAIDRLGRLVCYMSSLVNSDRSVYKYFGTCGILVFLYHFIKGGRLTSCCKLYSSCVC